jgi:hypothetical protein
LRPLAVLVAIVFGSATAIGFGLIATLVVFLILRGDYPQLGGELGALGRACVLFSLLAAIAGSALRATLKELHWRWYAVAGTGLAMAGIAAAYWPN